MKRDCDCGGHVDRDLVMRRGDTLFFQDQLFQDPVTLRYATAHAGEPPPPGMGPVNITGFVIWFTAKLETAIPDAQAPFQLDTSALGGVAITTPGTGTFTVTGSPLATVGFPDGDVHLRYDVQVMDLSGRVFTVEERRLTVRPDVTRATS